MSDDTIRRQDRQARVRFHERPKGQRAHIDSLALGLDPSRPDSLDRARGATGCRPLPGADRSQELSEHAQSSSSDEPTPSHRDELAAALRQPVVASAVFSDAPGPLATPLDIAKLWEEGADEPDYLVSGLVARSSVAILSGDTGAGKTWLALALTEAVLTGAEWLGHPVARGQVVYIDEENPKSIPLARLRALGLPPGDLHRLRFYSRTGAAVGDAGATDSRLAEILSEFSADLVVIDTATAATAVLDVNDNTSVGALYGRLRAVAERFGCAVVILHHDRKTQPGEGRAPAGQSMMGARQWAGQADLHLAVKKITREQIDSDDGKKELRTNVTLSFPKLRDGLSPDPVPLRIVSRKDGNRLLSAAVEVVPESDRPPSADEAMTAAIVAAVSAGAGPIQTADVADACDCDAAHGTFKRALKAAVTSGAIQKQARGVYALPAVSEPAI